MSNPSIQRLRELLVVDCEAGTIFWRVGRGRAAAGSEAGRVNVQGYRALSVDGQTLLSHRVVYFMATGEWVPRIDHINGNRTDNRIQNLRSATAADNARNRTNWRHRKLLGAHKQAGGGWSACITADGVPHYLGSFATEEEAHARYCLAREQVEKAERAARTAVLASLDAGRNAAQARHDFLTAANYTERQALQEAA